MAQCFFSLESAKIFNKLIFKDLEKEGFDGLSEALIVIFPYLEAYENITVAKLANLLGYSRQAMHKNIKKLENSDYLTLILENKKEKTIHFTKKSEKLMFVANETTNKIEKELAKLIGKKELEIYKINQMKIYDFLKDLDT